MIGWTGDCGNSIRGFILLAGCIATTAFVATGFVNRADAQDAPVATAAQPAATAPSASPGAPGTPPGTPPGGTPGTPPGGTPGGPSEKKPDGAPADGTATPEAGGTADKEAESGPTRRGAEPPKPADPEELKVRPDDDGRVSFTFRNQPWPALMVWLSEISDQPLDWQELPSDYVNLTSPGRYTLDETRDLFNRHLLARGYTMLRLDGGLTVVKTEGINPAVVPRVDADELAELQPHSFVRTSLDCGWLLSPKLAEELKPMISSNGRLVALEQTNRIEAMDAAINLQQIAALLSQEQSAQARQDLAREFELRHVPAEEAKQMLSAFLGIEEDKNAPPMSPQEMQQMQQMQRQMMQQNGGKMPETGEKKADISIVVNNRRNSLLVNAPPDRMAVAAQFIIQIDVPSDTLRSLADVQSRVQVFRLTTLDPAKLAEIASDMNILEPSTRLRVDEKNQALIVSGSAADRFIINSLVERLDGSARQFEVLQLRRLDAQEVAESIMFLMGTEEESDSSSNNRRYMYSYYGGFGNEEQKETDKFRVAANVRYRQVLLWANESEMAEVRNLLVKLGEIPPEGGSRRTVRLIEASSIPETYEYLQRLRDKLRETLPNSVTLPPAEAFADPISDALPPSPAEDAPAETSPVDSKDGEDNTTGKPVDDADARSASRGRVPTGDRLVSNPFQQVAQSTTDQAGAVEAEGSDGTSELPEPYPDVQSAEQFDSIFRTGEPKTAPQISGKPGAPIRIEVDDAGNLILLSEDTQALDRLETMMLEVEPPKRPYTVFRVRNASATWMMLNLEDYFADNEGTEDDSDNFMRWYFDMGSSDEEKKPGGLAQKNQLRFVADNDTGSIVVTGASTAELKTIGELIALWDVPEPLNKRQSRFTRLVQVQHSRAEKLADTIKEAYRDLLSSNDKAFSQGNPQGGGGSSTDQGQPRNRGGGGSGLVNTEGGKSSGDSSFTFKGKLSIGVDPVGNTLLVSAEGDDLLDLVCDMIRQLDVAAAPQGNVEIRSLPGTVSVDSLQTALRLFAPDMEPADRRPQPARNQEAAAPREASPQGRGAAPASENRPAPAAGDQ